MQSCVVVIPVYKARMSETELASFRQALSVFGKSQRTVVIATFSSLDVSRYEEEASICGVSLLFEHFPSDCFASIHSYNCMMLDPAFYGRFSGYDYILLFQLDAWVFEDRLDEWCAKGYDYVGAPLFAPGRGDLQCARTGNGGFSLRRVDAFSKALSSCIGPFVKRPADPYISFNKKMLYFAMLLFSGWCNAVRGFLTHWVDEDRFFSYTLLGTKYEMKVPSPQEALDFAFDMHPSVCFALNGNCLPMGCHQWPAFYDFWKGYITSDNKPSSDFVLEQSRSKGHPPSD